MSEGRCDRAYPSRPIVGVGAVVLVSAADRGCLGQSDPVAHPWGVVLIRRRFEPRAGEWSLPGGAVDVGETLHAAIAREVAEETGLTIEVGPIVEVIDSVGLDAEGRVQYHFVLIDYLCRPMGGRLASGSDASDVVIADPAALGPFALTEEAESVIRKAVVRIADG